MIPLIIHQIWIGPNKKPKEWMNTWTESIVKRENWEYILWDEERIKGLEMQNRDIYEKETDYACKADILRYEILYQYGGVYIDADIVLLKDEFYLFIEQNQNKIFFANEPNQKLIANSIIGVEKENYIMKFIIKSCYHNYMALRHKYYPYQVTGPYLITNLIRRYNLNACIYSSVLFYPIEWNRIQDPKIHLKYNFPHSMTFQYGYTTNNFKEIL